MVSERVAYRNFWYFYSVELFQLPPSLTTFASFSAIDAKMRKTAKIYENCRASPPGRILIKFSVSSLVDCTEQQFCTKATLLPLPLTIHSLCVGRSATRPSKSLYPIEGRIGPFRAAGYPVALHHIASRRLIERPKQIRLLRRNKSPQDTRKSWRAVEKCSRIILELPVWLDIDFGTPRTSSSGGGVAGTRWIDGRIGGRLGGTVSARPYILPHPRVRTNPFRHMQTR